MIERRILIVDDDEGLRASLIRVLAREPGYTIVAATTLAEVDDVMADEDDSPEAIVLDVGLPDGDGRDYCAKLRLAGCQAPVIILTGPATEEDVVRGLEAGANDYVAKPFRCNEMAARLQAQLRISDRSGNAAFTLGRFVFQPAKKQLRDIGKRVIHLTDKEVSVLRFLHRAKGAVNRDVLLTGVWGYNSQVTTHTLETHIYRLRQKIEVDPATPTLITTVQHGYRLEGHVLTAQ